MKSMFSNSPTSAEQPVLPGGFFPLVGQSIERVGVCVKNLSFSSKYPLGKKVEGLVGWWGHDYIASVNGCPGGFSPHKKCLST